MDKKKKNGQVYTPKHIVEDILNIVKYKNDEILKKHIIDNSCGDGAFLIEIVKRYIEAYKNKYNTIEGLKNDLEEYIHGIEIDEIAFNECQDNLNSLAFLEGLSNVKWDIILGDTLEIDKYNNKMDYVVGNPPYVRVHNLEEKYSRVKDFKFCKKGMTDLYIVFFEISFNMLNSKGKMSYITPNSFYTSVAGRELRQYIKNEKTLYAIMDLGHYQPFSATTYTTITAFENSIEKEHIEYYQYDKLTCKPVFVNKIKYDDLTIKDNIILSNNTSREEFSKIFSCDIKKSKISVKNAFATLADGVFIQKEFPFEENVIDILKASTGEWKKCIFPYNEGLKPIAIDEINDKSLAEYLYSKKEILSNRSTDKNTPWYCFGRSQGINDLFNNKIAINTTIKDLKSIKINKVDSGSGLYSGLYITSDYSYDEIKDIIIKEDFIDYIKSLNKCKSGGYFTFSSSDLKKYLVYNLEVDKNE